MRAEKIAILDEVVARVTDSDYCFIVNHGGVGVAQFAKLRAELKKLVSRFKFFFIYAVSVDFKVRAFFLA